MADDWDNPRPTDAPVPHPTDQKRAAFLQRGVDGAGLALEMCAREHDTEITVPDALAKAAVIAYLNLTGRDAEAAEVARHVGT